MLNTHNQLQRDRDIVASTHTNLACISACAVVALIVGLCVIDSADYIITYVAAVMAVSLAVFIALIVAGGRHAA
ncbi:hypothetical protein [Burkholderia perseverans]|uniref:hypothetical protein n=1 Tax=Burkholderia perseverans TaxID=2615214 RepID=UPI001FEF5B08|nr:hypothetical protein [Burkholderia perseverans]